MSELKHIPRASNFDELRHFTLDKNIPPILEVELDESFVAETEDCFLGALRDNPNRLYPRDTMPYSTRVPACLNPLCGPIYVNGVDEFLRGKEGVSRLDASEVELKQGQLPPDTQIIVLRPAL